MATQRSGVGGKFVTYRRKERLAAKPYGRPPPPPQENPNWFSDVIVPSARAIASGAGRILKSLLNDSDSSEDEEEYASEDDGNNDIHLGGDVLSQKNVTSSEILHGAENKRTIEQLIMQETFSREEYDRLNKALKSRVAGWEEAGERSLHSDPPNGLEFDKVIQEAKAWFDEKKMPSNSVKELAHGANILTTTEVERMDSGVSPVDVAKSYMEQRAPWASPKRHDFGTPSAVTRLFREETSHSVDRFSRTSLKNRSSLASGSWNFQEERRRVRSKAIDDLLHPRSSKIDPLSFAFAPILESAGSGKIELARGKRTFAAKSLKKFKPTDSLVDAGVSSDPALAALESTRGGSIQDSDAVHANVENAAPRPMQPSSLDLDENRHSDGHFDKMNDPPMTTEVRNESINGFSSSKASTPAGVALEQKNPQHDMEVKDVDPMNEKKLLNAIDGESNCALLGDAQVEVPIATETDSITSGSLQHEEIPLDTPQLPALQLVKQHPKRSGRNSQKTRGSGK